MNLYTVILSAWFFSLIPLLVLALYPLITWTNSLYPKEKELVEKEFTKPVSIIIVGYNEARFIKDKIESFLHPDEWIEGSELIVATGGSTDGTDVILETYRNRENIHVIIQQERLTKIDGVNMAVALSKNEFLVFSDCRQPMKKGSVRKLIAHFQNEEIGTVNSSLSDDRSFFRNVLNKIALWESVNGSSLNLFGALYAQRKSVYRKIPTDILFDDLFITVSTITQNKRLVQEKDAIIYDVNFNTYYNRDRIERLTRGLLVFITHHFSLIAKMPGLYLLRFITYKYAKIILPFSLCILIPCSLYILYKYLDIKYILALTILFITLLSIKKIRKNILLFIRINFFIGIATLKFIFLKQRSIEWKKLNENQIKSINENSSAVL